MDGATPRWADIAALGREAEATGFDAVWVSDHVGFGDPDGDWRGANVASPTTVLPADGGPDSDRDLRMVRRADAQGEALRDAPGPRVRAAGGKSRAGSGMPGREAPP
jgi:hypothetical protein